MEIKINITLGGVIMINLFKKKTIIWCIIVSVFIILVGAFVITGNKNTNKAADKINKKSVASAAENNANKSSRSNSNKANSVQGNDTAKSTEDNSGNTANTNNTNSTTNTGSANVPSTNPSVSKSNTAPNTSNTNSENKTNSSSASQSTTSPQQPKPVQKSQSQPAQTTPKVSAQSTPVKEEVHQSVSASPQKYVNNKLGLDITFPGSWKGKYTVSENSDGLAVIFKPYSNNSSQGGILFSIVKKNPEIENMLDTISGAKRYVTAKGVTYVIGGPTDIGFPPDNPEYSTYKQLSSERSSVVNNIQSIN
jgi:hypothetical protein